MTQELIASMLGVRREGITEAAGKLQRDGFIHYRRGHITMLERSGLETGACECYTVVKKELSRLLSDVRDHQGISPVNDRQDHMIGVKKTGHARLRPSNR
jgi:Mn-dependent DtxR family transcriptional regulator